MFELFAYNEDGLEILFLRSREYMTRMSALSWAAHNADLIGAVSFEVFENGKKILEYNERE